MPHERMILDQAERLQIADNSSFWQMLEQREYLSAIFKIAACKLANYEWMNEHFFTGEQIFENSITLSKVIYPDRRIDQNQFFDD